MQRPVSFTAVALLIVSAGLLVLSRVQHSGLDRLRWHLTELISPVLSAAMVPLEPVRWASRELQTQRSLMAENVRLREENQRLRGWEWRARELEKGMAALSVVAKVVEQSRVPFITARVIADASGPFARAALIEAGKEHSLRIGNPVISAEGLTGRLVETGRRAARVLLITDANSRVPVEVGDAGARAILVGDNTPAPRLQFTAFGAEIAAGDEVATSGVGGVIPRGLRVGRVVRDANGMLRVDPHARLAELDYVSVLLTDLPVLDIASDANAPPADARTRRAQARTGPDGR